MSQSEMQASPLRVDDVVRAKRHWVRGEVQQVKTLTNAMMDAMTTTAKGKYERNMVSTRFIDME